MMTWLFVAGAVFRTDFDALCKFLLVMCTSIDCVWNLRAPTPVHIGLTMFLWVQMDVSRCATLAGVQTSVPPLSGSQGACVSPQCTPCYVAPSLWEILKHAPPSPTLVPLLLQLMSSVAAALSELSARAPRAWERSSSNLPTPAAGRSCVEICSSNAAAAALVAMAGRLAACVQCWAASGQSKHLRAICLQPAGQSTSASLESGNLRTLLRVRTCGVRPFQCAAAALLQTVATQTASASAAAGPESNAALVSGLQTLHDLQDEMCAAVNESLDRHIVTHTGTAPAAAANGLVATLQLLAVLAVALPLQNATCGCALLERAWDVVLQQLNDVAAGTGAAGAAGLLEALLRLLPIVWLQLQENEATTQQGHEAMGCLDALLRLPLVIGRLTGALKEARKLRPICTC